MQQSDFKEKIMILSFVLLEIDAFSLLFFFFILYYMRNGKKNCFEKFDQTLIFKRYEILQSVE